MMRSRSTSGFTLAEMIIAMGGTTVIVGALLFSSVELQRSLHASESYASNQSDQRRLLDCLSRDIRRSIGVATTATLNGSNGTRLANATATIEGDTALLLTLPGYYQSNSPSDANYDEPLSIVAANNYVDYGSGTQHAPGVSVIFRKQYIVDEGCMCFVRVEGDSLSILVKHAENFHLTVTMSADGCSGTMLVSYLSPRFGSRTTITMRDDFLLRNIRLD